MTSIEDVDTSGGILLIFEIVGGPERDRTSDVILSRDQGETCSLGEGSEERRRNDRGRFGGRTGTRHQARPLSRERSKSEATSQPIVNTGEYTRRV